MGVSSKLHVLKEASPRKKAGNAGEKGGLKIRNLKREGKSAGDPAGSPGTGGRE